LCSSWSRILLYDFDFKEKRPELAGNEDPVFFRIEGDAVQGLGAASGRQFPAQGRHIYPAGDFARFGGYHCYEIIMPDVGEDFAFYVFELI